MKYVVAGQRIPQSFFIATGTGESDLTIHAGSYHLALRSAGIEMFNIMTYSSILPAKCAMVPPPKSKIHGAVLECIMSRIDVLKGIRGSAGIGFGFLYDSLDRNVGGLVVERHVPDGTAQDVEDLCLESLDELYANGYSHYRWVAPRVISASVCPSKEYGTALVALCFTRYRIPVMQ